MRQILAEKPKMPPYLKGEKKNAPPPEKSSI